MYDSSGGLCVNSLPLICLWGRKSTRNLSLKGRACKAGGWKHGMFPFKLLHLIREGGCLFIWQFFRRKQEGHKQFRFLRITSKNHCNSGEYFCFCSCAVAPYFWVLLFSQRVPFFARAEETCNGSPSLMLKLLSPGHPQHHKDLLCCVLSGRGLMVVTFKAGSTTPPVEVSLKGLENLRMKNTNTSLIWQCKALEPVKQVKT